MSNPAPLTRFAAPSERTPRDRKRSVDAKKASIARRTERAAKVRACKMGGAL